MMIRTLIALPPRRRQYQLPRSNQPWTAAEDRRLLRAVKRMESRRVEPWQAKPSINWGVIVRRHDRSHVAVRARLSLLRSAARIARGIGR